MRERCHHHRAGDLEHKNQGNVPLQKACGRMEMTITSTSLQLVFLLRYLMSYCESNVGRNAMFLGGFGEGTLARAKGFDLDPVLSEQSNC